MFSLTFRDNELFDPKFFNPSKLQRIKKWNLMSISNSEININEINQHIRKCYTTDKTFDFYTPYGKQCIFEKQENIDIVETFFTKHYNPIILNEITKDKKRMWLSCDNEGYNYQFRILKHDNGCFFQRHNNVQKNKFHIGTMILLPPKQYNEYTGGELIVYEKDENTKEEKETVFQSLDNNNWTFIFIKVGTEFEIKKVLSGVRYSFMCEYYMSEAMYYLLYNKSFQEKANLTDKNKQQIKRDNSNRILNIQRKIEKLQEELKILQNENQFQEKFIETIKKDMKNNNTNEFLVICQGFYTIPSLEKLSYKDKLVYNKLVDNFNYNIKFLNFAVEYDSNVCSNTQDYTDFHIGWDSGYYYSGFETTEMQKNGIIVNESPFLDNLQIYYYNNFEKKQEIPGEIQDDNAETYDSFYKNLITCMYVFKQ